jgi:hypothetical protein
MAYIGRSPTPGEVIVLNSIESQFNGVLTTFNLTRTTGGVTSDFYPVSTGHLLVSLGGVIQEPDPTGDTGFRINYNTIIFAVAPLANTSCFIISYGNIIDIGAPADLTVTPFKLSTGGPSWDTSGNVTVGGNLTVNGSTTTINSTTLTIDDKNIVVADGQSTSAGIDTAGIDFGTSSVKLRYYHNGGTNSGLNIEGTNVGIGTASPEERLHVQGVGIITSSLYVGGTSSSSNYLIISNLGQDIIRPNGRILLRGGGSQSTRNSIELTNSAGIVIDGGSGETYGVEIKGGGGPVKITQGNVGIGTTNPSDKLDVAGNVIPNIDATYNLGSTTKRWNNVYTTDLQLSNEGSQNDVDGTWGQYTIQEGENDLFLLNRRNGKKYKFVLQEVG